MYLATSAGGSARGGRSEDGASGGSVAVETGCAADSTFGASCILARRPHGGERLARDGGRRVDCSTAVWNSRQFLLFTLPLQASASVVAFCPRGPVHGQRVVWTPVSVTRTAPTMSSHTRSNFSICLTDSGSRDKFKRRVIFAPVRKRSKTQADQRLTSAFWRDQKVVPTVETKAHTLSCHTYARMAPGGSTAVRLSASVLYEGHYGQESTEPDEMEPTR